MATKCDYELSKEEVEDILKQIEELKADPDVKAATRELKKRRRLQNNLKNYKWLKNLVRI